jgi:hypothetical protein
MMLNLKTAKALRLDANDAEINRLHIGHSRRRPVSGVHLSPPATKLGDGK